MSAYAETYLADAMDTLGEAFDCAQRCGVGVQRFFDLFCASGVAASFGEGCPRLTAGMPGAELCTEVLELAGQPADVSPVHAARWHETKAYWCGWVLAYFQWRTAIPFEHIRESVRMEQVQAMYHPYHEMSEEHFADALLAETARAEPMLKTVRRARGITQAELARRSQVSLRAIQQYEQGAKDISKAQAASVLRMARVLGCRMEDLVA